MDSIDPSIRRLRNRKFHFLPPQLTPALPYLHIRIFAYRPSGLIPR